MYVGNVLEYIAWNTKMTKIGERVGALLCADDKLVQLIGFGVYVGDEIPPKEIGDLGFFVPPWPNPRINLDNGFTVYGCQCWWGGENSIKDSINNRDVIYVDPGVYSPDARKKEIKSQNNH